jgi:aryl-alcohol dehydrogenase-like predicted oxidoreductase
MEQLEHRPLGASGIEVPVVAFGAWAIGGWNWGGSDDAVARDAIRAGLDAGMTAIDTAPVYGFGRSESVVGEALRGRRDEVVLMTKAGLRKSAIAKYLCINEISNLKSQIPNHYCFSRNGTFLYAAG